MPSTKKRPAPEFGSEDEERAFWAAHESTEFIDWQSARRRRFPNLKPTRRTISLRLPVSMIEDLKVLANQRDVPWPKDWRRNVGAHSEATARLG